MSFNGINRREFLFMGAVATAAVVSMPRFSLANVKQATLSDCMDMSPEEMARQSKLVTDSYDYLLGVVDSIQDAGIRKGVKGIIKNPAPTIMSQLADPANRKAAYADLKAQGYVEKTSQEDFLPAGSADKSPQPFLSSPGSGYQSHHSYPGGVVTHTAANLMLSDALYNNYKKVGPSGNSVGGPSLANLRVEF